ncbi:GIY-YIG nuclease family protein [Melioribacteraceae bacterium 4301-Me]|uniref:GIY-YIG nuclease family protein n=1 Tax=Pyranulibacter aquaticus TaxID=3163344 RepID=UPI0035957E53
MPFVYIIRSQQGHIYVGSTTNLQNRLQQHNDHIPFWTKRGTNWKLIYHEKFSSL